jgi:hypothetical protein
MEHAYRFMHDLGEALPVGIAVQDGNYAAIDPTTQRPTTGRALIEFAEGYLHARTMFWCTEEPYYSRDVLPRFRSR